jgi:hypothetical protein
MDATAISSFGERRVLFSHGHGVDVVILPAMVASALPPELDDALRCGFSPGRRHRADRVEMLGRCDAFTT